MRESQACLGIFGGTFDPFHSGHLGLARAAIRELSLDLLLVVPCGSPAHRGKAVASPEQRLEMARIGLAGEPAARVEDLEIRRPGPSYTVDTLREVCEKHRVVRPWLVLGADSAAELQHWKEWKNIVELARLSIAARASRDLDATLVRYLDARGTPPRYLQTALPDVSASGIRAACARGEAVATLLPEGVGSYIVSQGLYRAPAEAGPTAGSDR